MTHISLFTAFLEIADDWKYSKCLPNRGLVKLKLCLDHGILYLQKEWEGHLCTNIKWPSRYTVWGKKDNKGQYMVGKIWEKQYRLFANICKKHSWKDTWKAGNTSYGKRTESGELRWELLFSCVWLFVTPWTAAHQASLSFTISPSLLKLMSIESVMPSSYLILSPLSPPALSLSQHQGLSQWVGSLHQMAKVLEV